MANGHLIRVQPNGRAYISRLLHPYNEFLEFESNDGALLYADENAVVTLADSTIQNIHSSDADVGIIRTVGQADITLRNCVFRDVRNLDTANPSRAALLRGFLSLPELTLDRIRAEMPVGGYFIFGRVNTTIRRSSLENAPIRLERILPILTPPALSVHSSTLINGGLTAYQIDLAHSYLRNLNVRPEFGGSASHCAFDFSGVDAGGTSFTSGGYNAWYPFTVNIPVFTHPEDIETLVFLTGRDQTGPTVVYRPAASSPLVDAGDPALTAASPDTPKTDQTGNARVIDGSGDGIARIDIGPVEYAVPRSTVVVTTASDDPVFGTTLRQALATMFVDPPLRIVFDPGLSGATFQILESNGPLTISTGPIEIDASMLAQRPRLTGSDFFGNRFNSSMPHIQITGGAQVVIRNFRFSELRRVIDVDSSSLTLADCVFTDNGGPSQTTPAAAVIVQGIGSFLTLEECVFARNRAAFIGAAIHMNAPLGGLVVRGCRFTDNDNTGFSGYNGRALPGSAIHVAAFLDPVEITDTTFSGNTSYALYLGLQNAPGINQERRRIVNCTFAHNHRAIAAPGTDFVLRHCTIARHSSDQIRPAIYLFGTAHIGHSIIANNRDPVQGTPSNANGPTLDVPGGNGQYISEGYNIEDGDDLGLSGPGDRPRTDPLLAPFAPFAHYGGNGRSFALLAESPAIDGGNPDLATLPAADIRGYPRATDGTGNGKAIPDIGSFEAGVPVVVGQLAPKSDNQPPYSLPEAVALAAPGGRVLFDRSLGGGSITLTAPLVPGKDFMIDASSLLQGPRIGGGDATRLLVVGENQSVSCHALTFRRGFHSGDGGAIRNAGNLCLHACAVVRSEAGGVGGGLYQDGGNLTLEQTTFAENTAATGGGAIADNPSRRANLVEFQNGTHPRIFDGDPQQPGDFLITAVAPNGTPGSLDITFTSDVGTSYTIQYSLDLQTPWADLATLTANAAETTVTATLPTPLQSEPRAFFRVRRNP